MTLAVEHTGLRGARIMARLPQLTVAGAAIVLCLLGLRTLVAGTPRPAPAATGREVVPAAVPGFAEGFARAWMSWDADHPQRRDAELARYLSADLGPGGGLQPPPTGRSLVRGASTVEVRRTGPSAWTAVVELTTDTGPGGHLAVTVHRDRTGRLGVLTAPALVGPPSPSAVVVPGEEEVQDGRVQAMARRALGNLLAGDRGNLRADLAPGAHIPVPSGRLRLDSLDSLTWQQPGRVAAALVTATDRHTGALMTLRYALYLTRTGRRPALLSIALPPLTKETP